MTSPLVPQATIVLNGQEYTMRLDLNALSDFEAMTGKSIMKGGLTDIANLELADIRALLWACLVQENEELTIRDVGRLIQLNDIASLAQVVTDMVIAAMPETEEGAEGKGPLTETSSAQLSGGLDSTPQEPKTSD